MGKIGRRFRKGRPYQEKIIELGLDVQRRLGPGVHHIMVEHDDDCPKLLGTGPCKCDTNVRLARNDEEWKTLYRRH